MQTKKFNFWNRIVAGAVFLISAVTYLSTIEPTASFWDCGEFIASSYKLEVGHPPGNPTFQLIARVFTMFGDNMHAAVAVNAMSALCSALTIFFLYLTIVFFLKRMIRPREDGTWSTGDSIAIFGSAAVGSLVYCFSDTFWFSAVEAEVYAMSSLFTAVVFWAMTKWYEQADTPYANRWIVFICFMMGLSIGVHLLNLLTIPALVFMFYFKKREEGTYSFGEYIKILLVSGVILGILNFILVPWLPKVAAWSDLFFVNVLGFPYNSGAAFFMIALLVLCFVAIFQSLKKNRVVLNTVMLCFTSIVIGFSIFSIDIIRSCVKTPTNEYQPDNAFTLVRYLSREQYGKTPLLYGQYFDAPYDIKTGKYWAPLNGKYQHVSAPSEAVYKASGKMLFPRMWSDDPTGRYEEFYEGYMKGKGQAVEGAKHKKPSFFTNIYYFLDYQLNWMYWRYFMWNFVGRQNDIASPTPGELFYGNWESGIKFIDNARLGDQELAPAPLKDNTGKNHYFFLPLLLGLIGLFFQFDRDRRGCWVVFLLFLLTGIAIVIYLNQPPYQVRERDYAYAGSFYAFSIWAGFAVAALYSLIGNALKGKYGAVSAAAVTVICLLVPARMAAENWDDHDRSNRSTAVEMARNYLNSVGENGILITHGDNDTFPLWYAQEVENVRTDVRIVNTSLLGTDWHIDQMKYAVNESAPLDLKVGPEQYLYGTNEYVYINDTRNQAFLLSDVMKVFRHPDAKVVLASGEKVDYIMSRRLLVPVNKENVLKCGLVPESMMDQVPDTIEITIPKDKNLVTKPELFLLDLLSNYNWDRPLHVLNFGGDLNVGIKDYLFFNGYSEVFVPIRNRPSTTDPGKVDTEKLYHLMKDVYSWDALSREDYNVDYQNYYTHLGVLSQRGMFVNSAIAFMAAGQNDRALEMLDMCQEKIHPKRYPLESVCIGFSGNDYMVTQMISLYYKLGQDDKARKLAAEFKDDLLVTCRFYKDFYPYSQYDLETCTQYYYYLCDMMDVAGDEELAKKYKAEFSDIMGLGPEE